jgi:hypothetical protein
MQLPVRWSSMTLWRLYACHRATANAPIARVHPLAVRAHGRSVAEGVGLRPTWQNRGADFSEVPARRGLRERLRRVSGSPASPSGLCVCHACRVRRGARRSAPGADHSARVSRVAVSGTLTVGRCRERIAPRRPGPAGPGHRGRPQGEHARGRPQCVVREGVRHERGRRVRARAFSLSRAPHRPADQ